MGELGRRVDIQKLISLGDDLIGVLSIRKDGETLMQAVDGEKAIRASAQTDAHELQLSIDEYEKRINMCKERIDKTRNETISDAELERLQHELEENLQKESSICEELRVIHEELNGLESQRISIEERKELIKKREDDLLRAQNVLSMCASVTNIIPDLEDRSMISGFVVDRSKKKTNKFDIDPSLPPAEASNRLWKMANLD